MVLVSCWLIPRVSPSGTPKIPPSSFLSPGRASSQCSINHMFIVYPEHVDASILEKRKLQKGQENGHDVVVGSGSRLRQWASFIFPFFYLSPPLPTTFHTSSPGPHPDPHSLAECGPRTMMAPLSAHTCSSYIFSRRLATSLRMMVPIYSITIVCFSRSLAA